MDLNSQVEGSLIMPATFDTVVSRTQLAMVAYLYLWGSLCVFLLECTVYQIRFTQGCVVCSC